MAFLFEHNRPMIEVVHRHLDRWAVSLDDEIIGPDVSRGEATAIAQWLDGGWEELAALLGNHWNGV